MDRRVLWLFWIFAAIGAYFLVIEHREHLFEYLPYLLLIACPLMHLFGHRHGHGGEHQSHQEKKEA